MISKYWFNRIINNYKKNGLFKFILEAFKFLNKILNPNHTGEFPFKYLFLKKRKAIRSFTKNHLDTLDDNEITTFGNYLLNPSLLDKNSIVYSGGVGTSISFEKNLAKKIDCSIYCFDPTSLAVNFMKDHLYDRNKITFKSCGVWNKDEKIKFYLQDKNNPSNTGGSITNLFQNQEFELLECFKIKTLMKKNNHFNIDLLKLDIEGAGLEVMKDMITDNILPTQIITEFEYSEDDNFDENDFNEWSYKVEGVIKLYREKGYKCYNLPRVTHMAFSSIEVLFIKKTI